MTAAVPTDLQDERLRRSTGLADTVRGGLGRIRDGDLGLLPVLAGLVIIWTIFQVLSPFFLSPGNLSDLLMQSAPVGVIALGIVFVLLLGEIDLSVGSVSGLSSAIFAVQFVNNRLPLAVAILLAVLAGAVIGWVYGQIYNRVGIPSFVITLAGLLGFLGLQLAVLGQDGTINIPFDSPLVQLGQLLYVPAPLAYGLVVVAVAVYVVTRLRTAGARRRAGLSAPALSVTLVQAAVLAIVLLAATAYLYAASQGIGWMFVFFVALVLAADYALRRTGWGRALFAVGGNKEAARRSGIRVKTVVTSAFILCTTLAAIGGLLAAGRLSSAAQSSGGGDVNLNAIAAAVIGGTSLFGGRGSAYAALLGILVIASISSGLTLLNLPSSVRYMVTGAVVLIAVGLDALARRSRTTHGRA